MWQSTGLQAPTPVLSATKDYRDEQDVLLGFIRDCCAEDADARASSSELLTRYKTWTGDKEMTEQKFGRMLKEKGFTKKKNQRAHLACWYRTARQRG